MKKIRENSGYKTSVFIFRLAGLVGQFQIHSFFKNIYYKNIEAEICEILRINPRLRF